MNHKLSIALLVIFAALLALPVHAQDPIGGALATLAAATSAAQQAAWARQAQATRQAQSLAATSQAQQAQAQSTRQAQAAQAQATAQALDADATATVQAHAAQLAGQVAATATANFQSAQATSQAVDAAQAERATVAAGDALATAQVYRVTIEAVEARSNIGTALVLCAGIIALSWIAAQVSRRRVSDASGISGNDTTTTQNTIPTGAVIIDYTPEWTAMGTMPPDSQCYNMPPVDAMPPAQAVTVAGRLDAMLAEGQ